MGDAVEWIPITGLVRYRTCKLIIVQIQPTHVNVAGKSYVGVFRSSLSYRRDHLIVAMEKRLLYCSYRYESHDCSLGPID